VTRERSDDLLEGLLDEIVVIGAALSDDPIEGLIDDAKKPIVDLRGYLVVAPPDCVDQGLVRRGRQFSFRGLTHEQAKPIRT
jgi:hypothetical protein